MRQQNLGELGLFFAGPFETVFVHFRLLLRGELRKTAATAPLSLRLPLLLVRGLSDDKIPLRRRRQRSAFVVVVIATATTALAIGSRLPPTRTAAPAKGAGIFSSQFLVHLLDLGNLLVGQFELLLHRVVLQQAHAGRPA